MTSVMLLFYCVTVVMTFMFNSAGNRARTYDNNLGGILFRLCPSRHVVSHIKSAHFYFDRQWSIDCKPFNATLRCFWSSFHLLYEQELSHNCPPNHVIDGVHSDFDKNHGDRRWSFRCCTASKLVTFECRETPMVNYWDEDFDWHVPGDNFLTGVLTHKKDNYRDHRWSFNYCRATTLDTQVNISQILTPTDAVRSYSTEGDVIVPKTRSVSICNKCKWPKFGSLVKVPYLISSSFSSSEKEVIGNAISVFHLSTCVRFIPRNNDTSYINIVKRSGCWSVVGQTGDAQELSLGDGCVRNGIVQHELIHALGFSHEQSRVDRDIYIKINYDNIQEGREDNFKQLETNNLNVPYDYSSLMHYGPKDFSKNGLDTITPLLPTATIGQRISMSENDVKKINKLYSCYHYLHKHDEWDNRLCGVLSRQCASGQAVSSITSGHSVIKSDRFWAVSCKTFMVTKACRWSGYVNEYWGNLDFKCPDNQVVAGVYSEYSSIVQDRKWKFYCCRVSGFTMFNCIDDPVINYWTEYFSWPVPSGNYLTGVKSSFNTDTRDRRWSFSYCQRTTVRSDA